MTHPPVTAVRSGLDSQDVQALSDRPQQLFVIPICCADIPTTAQIDTSDCVDGRQFLLGYTIMSAIIFVTLAIELIVVSLL